MKSDLLFLGGSWLGSFPEMNLSKEKKYLLKYFDTPIQAEWLYYVFLFGDSKNFVDHTGIYCTPTYLYNLDKKLNKIQEKHKFAKSTIDLETLANIESGKLILS